MNKDLFTTYLLHIHLSQGKTISIGKLGRFYFKKGNYIYVGSAKTNFIKRIARHMGKRKKRFWHIDYLLQYAKIKGISICKIPEEKLAKILSKKIAIPVKGFGSSDTKAKSHLFYHCIDNFNLMAIIYHD